MKLKWNELGPRIEDKKVAPGAAGVARIEGKVQVVGSDACACELQDFGPARPKPKAAT